jgi:hypothetical protein
MLYLNPTIFGGVTKEYIFGPIENSNLTELEVDTLVGIVFTYTIKECEIRMRAIR